MNHEGTKEAKELKKVPAEICDNCGEYYLSDAVTEQVLDKAELEIIRYAA